MQEQRQQDRTLPRPMMQGSSQPNRGWVTVSIRGEGSSFFDERKRGDAKSSGATLIQTYFLLAMQAALSYIKEQSWRFERDESPNNEMVRIAVYRPEDASQLPSPTGKVNAPHKVEHNSPCIYCGVPKDNWGEETNCPALLEAMGFPLASLSKAAEESETAMRKTETAARQAHKAFAGARKLFTIAALHVGPILLLLGGLSFAGKTSVVVAALAFFVLITLTLWAWKRAFMARGKVTVIKEDLIRQLWALAHVRARLCQVHLALSGDIPTVRIPTGDGQTPPLFEFIPALKLAGDIMAGIATVIQAPQQKWVRLTELLLQKSRILKDGLKRVGGMGMHEAAYDAAEGIHYCLKAGVYYFVASGQ